MVRGPISSLLRPTLRRFKLLVLLILVLWISTWINTHFNVLTNLLLILQQQQPEYNETSQPQQSIIGSLYPPGFNYSNSKLCPENGKNVKLLIMSTSPPLSTHQENRISIRNTWRHFTLSPDGRQNIVIGFMMGIKSMENDTGDNFTIKQEIDEFNDIVIGNFIDSYDNLTLKTLSILEWALSYCSQAKYLLKTDDDMWINIPKFLKYTESLANGSGNHSTIYGKLLRKESPHRLNTTKNFVSYDHYPFSLYPDFVVGPAYLLPQETWQSLYVEGLQTKFFKLEDVFLTGIVASKLGIPRVNISNFLMTVWKNRDWSDTIINKKVASKYAVIVENSSDLNHIWNAYNSSCRYGKNDTSANNCVKLFANALFQARKRTWDYQFEKENRFTFTVSSANALDYIGIFILVFCMLVSFFNQRVKSSV